jgi:hypothetical protein
MMAITASWVGIAAVMMGIGLGLRRILTGRRAASIEDLLLCFWLGWIVALGFLQLWHLVFPVRALALCVVVALGTAGWLAARICEPGWFRVGDTSGPRLVRWVQILVFVGAAIFLANHASGIPGSYDNGLYHLSAIRWTREHAIVPGLGNLHGRLAFNNASFLYSALIELTPGLAVRTGNTLLVMVLIAQAILAAPPALFGSGSDGSSVIAWFYVAVLPFIALTACSRHVTSATPDLPVIALGVVLTAELSAFLTAPREADGDALRLTQIFFLSVGGIAVKTSFLIFAVASLGLATAVAYRRGARSIRAGLLLGGLILLPWAIRGMILSGYPAYPSTLGGLAFDWAIPATTATEMRHVITSWARQPHQAPAIVLADWQWFSGWLSRTLAKRWAIQVPGVMLVLGLAFAMALRVPWRSWILIIPTFASLMFWFFTAPDPRLSNGAAWLLAAIPLALAAARAKGRQSAIPAWSAAALSIGLSLWILVDQVPKRITRPSSQIGFRSMGEGPVTYRQLPTGLTVATPTKDDRCWDARLPCTPSLQPTLRLRRPGDLSSGFTVR